MADLILGSTTVMTESSGTVTVGNSNVALSTGLSNLGGMFLISSSSSTSSVSSVDFDNTVVTPTYKTYILHIDRMRPDNDQAELYVRLSTNNLTDTSASGFLSGTTGRMYSQLGGTGTGQEQTTLNSYMQIATDTGNDANLGVSAEISIYNSQDTSLSNQIGVKAVCFGKHNSEDYAWWSGAYFAHNKTAMNGIRIQYDGGTIGFHSVRLYGLK